MRQRYEIGPGQTAILMVSLANQLRWHWDGQAQPLINPFAIAAKPQNGGGGGQLGGSGPSTGYICIHTC